MKIYYSDARRNAVVSSKQPVEAGVAEAKQLLSRLVTAPSYLGILIDEATAFQAYLNPDGTVWIEKLSLTNQELQGVTVKLALALEAIDAIYAGQDFIQVLAPHYLRWANVRV